MKLGALVERVLTARRAIPAGRVQLQVRYPVVGGAMAEYARVTRDYEIWFTGDSSDYKATVQWRHPKSTWTATTLRNTDGILYEPGAWAIHGERSSKVDEPQLQRAIFEPRVLGLVVRPVLELDQENVLAPSLLWVNDEAQSSCKLTEGDASGRRVVVAEYAPYDGYFVEASFAPEFEYNVVRASLRMPERRMRREIECEYQPHVIRGSANTAHSGRVAWFPSRVIASTYDSEKLVFREEATVVSAEFSSSVPDVEFTLGSLEIPEGRRVIDIGDARNYVWEHGTLRPATSNDRLDEAHGLYMLKPAAEMKPEREPSVGPFGITRTRLLLLVNIAFATAAVVWYGMAARRRRYAG